MNREQKRAFVKKAQEKGVDKEAAKIYTEIFGSDAGTPTTPQDITDGEKVKLNLESIQSRKNYERLTKKYKEFLETNKDTIFTAHVERPTLISFVEEPKWLFWSGDLIKVKQEGI